jgi:hypothetical protein
MRGGKGETYTQGQGRWCIPRPRRRRGCSWSIITGQFPFLLTPPAVLTAQAGKRVVRVAQAETCAAARAARPTAARAREDFILNDRLVCVQTRETSGLLKLGANVGGELLAREGRKEKAR